jgi:hypothetical protein
MNEIDREKPLCLLKSCGLTEFEAKACLHNSFVTMLLVPILERLNRIESRRTWNRSGTGHCAEEPFVALLI